MDEEQSSVIEQGPMAAPSGGPSLAAVQKLRWLRLPDEYGRAGFRANVWVNCPSGVMDDAIMTNAPAPPDYTDLERKARDLQDREQSGEDLSEEIQAIDDETRQRQSDWREQSADALKRRTDALCKIVVEHNGWHDNDGKILPQPSDPAFWGAIPDELTAAIILLIRREGQRLPSGIARAGNRR